MYVAGWRIGAARMISIIRGLAAVGAMPKGRAGPSSSSSSLSGNFSSISFSHAFRSQNNLSADLLAELNSHEIKLIKSDQRDEVIMK